MNDFDLLTDDEYRRLIIALGGQELFVCQRGNERLKAILGDKADEFIKRFRGDRIYIKKHALEHAQKRQWDYICAVKAQCQSGKSVSVAIRHCAMEFGITERWGYELYARYKGGRLIKTAQLALF